MVPGSFIPCAKTAPKGTDSQRGPIDEGRVGFEPTKSVDRRPCPGSTYEPEPSLIDGVVQYSDASSLQSQHSTSEAST